MSTQPCRTTPAHVSPAQVKERWNPQIVLLGAGLDTRAFRLPLPATCSVFEIDYAEAFTEKEAILSTAGARVERRYVHADLSG